MNYEIKYKMKKHFLAVYILLFVIACILTLGRMVSIFRPDFIMFCKSFHYSVSNLCISMIWYLSIGRLILKYGLNFRWVVITGLLLITANFICETLMGFMNTADILDAIFGTIGALIAFLFLLVTKYHGLESIM